MKGFSQVTADMKADHGAGGHAQGEDQQAEVIRITSPGVQPAEMAYGMVADYDILAVGQHPQQAYQQGNSEKDIELPVNDVVTAFCAASGVYICMFQHDSNTYGFGAYKFTENGKEIQ